MNTVFLGGSRHISQLAPVVRTRLDRIVERDLPVVVGDAAGADKALQRYLAAKDYRNVTVFCSGGTCRNNAGDWTTHHVAADARSHTFAFFAAKDREMARLADFGLMVWDGHSGGTIMNVLRLLRQAKKVAVYSAAERHFTDLTSEAQLDDFVTRHGDGIKAVIEARLAPEDLTLTAAQHATAVGAP